MIGVTKRRPHKRRLALIWCAVCCVYAPQVAAELLVYEPFDYPIGSTLLGQNGGIGFTGAWHTETAVGTATIQPGLTYAGLNVSGNSVLMSGQTGTYNIFRDHVNVEGDDGTQTWISFIGQRLGPAQNPPANPNNLYPRGVNISFYNTEGFAVHGREQFAIGNSSNSPTHDWAFIGHGQVQNIVPSVNPPVAFGGTPPAFVVVRIDHHGPPNMDGPGNNDDIYFFINPSLAEEPTPATANAQRLGSEPNTFDYSGLDNFRPFIGNTSGAAPYGELLWDELRIGTSYADVTGGTFVPILPGDTDGDGVPGEFPDDFEPIRAHFRQPVTMRGEGDLNRDAFVDFKDFREWKSVFLGGGGSLADIDLSFIGSVPEPSTYLLVLVACGWIVVGQRRRLR